VPETTTAATAGVGADLNPPTGHVPRRWWRRAGAALLIVMLLAAAAAIYGAYGYVAPEPGRSYHSAYLAGLPWHYADTPVARFFARRDFTVASRTHAADLELRADDGPFATGTGPLVTGSTLALVMSMAGRVSYLAELDGPGVPTLRSRLQAAA